MHVTAEHARYEYVRYRPVTYIRTKRNTAACMPCMHACVLAINPIGEEEEEQEQDELEVTGEGTAGGPFGLKKVLFVRKKSEKSVASKEVKTKAYLSVRRPSMYVNYVAPSLRRGLVGSSLRMNHRITLYVVG